MNHFQQVIQTVEKVKNLAGPVYNVDHKSSFQELIKGVEGISQLHGPVYHVDSNHHFSEVLKHVEELKNLDEKKSGACKIVPPFNEN